MGALRINHNASVLNTHRNIINNNTSVSKTLERLSSGMRINRGADGPASLIISEHMRAQIAGLNQAIKNSETASSMIQTTESSLSETSRLLVSMRQLAVHASNEAVNDETMLAADQEELNNSIQSIDRIAANAEFGTKKLLDGSNGATGATTGKNLYFVGAGTETSDSRQTGFNVNVSQVATKAAFEASEALTDDVIFSGETLTVIEDGKIASYKTKGDETASIVVNNLQQAIEKHGLAVRATLSTAGKIIITHNEYGADSSFQVSSTTDGILSAMGGQMQNINNGQDIAGSINGEAATGKGQTLTSVEGQPSTSQLAVKYTGTQMDLDNTEIEGIVGKVYVTQKSLKYQIGGNYGQVAGISIYDTHARSLGTAVANDSNFSSLQDLDLTHFQGAQDSIKIVDNAIGRLNFLRGQLGAFQKNTLESNLNNLRVARESMISSESTIRDADMAEEMSNLTKSQILTQSSMAMLAQANQVPSNILKLLS